MRNVLFVALLALVPVPAAAQTASPADAAEIRTLIKAFDAAIQAKDLPAMTALFHDGQIVWRGTLHPKSRDIAARLSGQPQKIVETTGAHLFLNDPRFAKMTLRERFGRPVIDSDGQLGSANFNYAFALNDQVQNWGRESWQLVKTDKGWRILALLFSAHLVQESPMPAAHLAGEDAAN